MVKSPEHICLLCKGSRALCGHKDCPRLAAVRVAPKINEAIDKDFFGPSPSVFVGRVGYPNINVGPMGTFEAMPYQNDNPPEWLSLDYSTIIELRTTLLRSKKKQNIFSKNYFIDENQQLALASKPTDIEMNFTKKPEYKVTFSEYIRPMGPSASLEKLRITENPRIDRKVDYIVNDDLKAAEQAVSLFNTNIDVYKITNILSIGSLGLEKNKKLVPTRWSITATDDILGKNLIERVKDYKSVNDFLVFESNKLDNHFLVMLMPGSWEFENFEAWAPGGIWTQGLTSSFITQEYEPWRGRTKYAEKQAGGYYASRLGVVEALNEFRRQARVVVFREVNEGYVVPLGVWQVRENVRNALREMPMKFDTRESALEHIDSKLQLPIENYIKQSRMLRQARLSDY
ncbi:MAG: Nre family DNA repair protein [archaeon]